MKVVCNVIQTIEVELDESKITKEFMDEFSSYMWDVHSPEDIAQHVAWNKALYDGYAVEGVPKEFYKANIVYSYVEVEDQ